MAQVTNEMATNLSLDVSSAKKSLQELTAVVKNSNNEWKIQETQMKSAGDAVGASKVRYEGLQQTLDVQKNKIDSLKNALANNNTETKKGQELQNYLSNELIKAERQYSSYQGQLDKATNSYKYQESGLAHLNNELKHGNDLTDARVKKLEAEGRTEEANKVKLQGLKDTQENYTKQLKIQQEELKSLAQSGDKNSENYKRQKLRVEQMGAKVAETTRDIKNFNKTEIKPETSGIHKVKEQLSSLDKSLEGTRSRFKSIFLGNLVANGVTNMLSSIKSHFTGAIGAGTAYNKELSNIKIGLDNFTGSNEELTNKLLNNIKAVKESSGYASSTVSLLTKKTYGLTKSAEGAKELTDAFTNLGRATGKSDEGMQNLVTKLFQANASGQITSGALTKLNKELPGFTSALEKNLGVTRDQLNELAKDGKLKMEDLGNAIKTMSDSKPKGLENYYKTVDGFTNHFEERYKSLSGKITEGFFTQSNGLLASLSKSLDGNAVDKSFSRIGESANKAVNTITKAFSNTFKDSKTNPIASMADFTANSIDKLGKFISKNANKIKSFFKMAKDLGGAGFSVIGTSLKIALPFLEKIGEFASKHPQTFKILAASIIGFNLALKGTLATMQGVDKAKGAFSMLSGLIVKPKIDGSDAKRELGILGKTAKGIGKGLKWTASIATKGAKLALQGLTSAAKVAGSGIKLAFNFMKANPLILLVTAIAAVTLAFVELYKHNKKFKAFVDGLVKSAKEFFTGISKWFGQAWKAISGFFSKVINFVKKDWKEILLFIVNPFAGAFALIYKHNDKFKKSVDNLVKSVVKFFKDMEKNISKIFNDIKDFISDTLNGINKIWHKSWSNITNFFKDTWNGIKKFGSDSITSMHDKFFDVLGKIGKIFSDTWTGIKKGFGDMWNGMKKLAGDGINAVIKIPNIGIEGINNLIHDFGGPKAALGKIPEVKFATGTGYFGSQRRAIEKPTLALLNDGFDSPETGNREALIHPNGAMEILQGQNINRLLMPGTEVLNAKELATIMGVTPFATGTGFLGSIWDGLKDAGSWVGKTAGNVWSGMKDGAEKFAKMFEFITSAVAHPIKTLEEKFNPKTDDKFGTVFNGLGNGAFKKLKNTAKDWWSELWNMANSSSDSGTSSGSQGDSYPWKSVVMDSGADPWGYFYRECVSYVASSLKNMGVSTKLFSGLGNGSDWVNAPVRHTKDPKPGMVAVYGPGSDLGNHVAMVRGVKGDTFSGEEYNWGGDGNYHTYSGRKISGVTTFLDFGKTGGSDSSKDTEAKSPLQALIKKQVGGMFEWIQKFIGPSNDTSTGVGGDVQSWSNDVKRALKTLGLSTSNDMVQRVLRQIQSESGGNPKAIQNGYVDVNTGGNEARGLMQVTPQTFAAYALPGHKDWANGYDSILAGLNYAKDRYGPDLSFLGNGHGYANGGLITKHQIAEIGEGNKPEMIIPLDSMKSSRGFELLGKTAVAMAARDNVQVDHNEGTSKDIIDELKTAVALLTQLVIGQKDNIPNVLLDKNELYRQQATDTNLRNYQSLT